MKRKRIVLVVYLLLSNIYIFCQTGFIEVEVRDTIKLKASKLEYSIEIPQNQDYIYDNNENNIAETRKKIKEKTKQQVKEIEQFLKKENYNYRLPENGYLVNNNPLFQTKSFIITLKNKTEITKVKKDFEKFDYVNISFREAFFQSDSETEIEKRLFKKLIEKATKKASMIAQLSNLKLGKIIEFKEIKEIDNLNFSFMDLYILSKKNPKSSSQIIYSSTQKAIVVKFAANQ
ncbi:hypothetical protein [uncultured Tenacibaculum sp.]|uniref:hypothetical protein n=1 Tax=uncultured Tenacibaculum sp. TaxID=174713 RepID=UPI0026153694|nr:hypothetical protein [uncultured Tenacibaculum sp.]